MSIWRNALQMGLDQQNYNKLKFKLFRLLKYYFIHSLSNLAWTKFVKIWNKLYLPFHQASLIPYSSLTILALNQILKIGAAHTIIPYLHFSGLKSQNKILPYI